MNKIRELLDGLIVDNIESDISTIKLKRSKLINYLKKDIDLKFTQLVDLCAVDYIEFGNSEWQTREPTSSGYNRGIKPSSHGRINFLTKKLRMNLSYV